MRARVLGLLAPLSLALLAAPSTVTAKPAKPAKAAERPGMSLIPAGTFRMGSAEDDPLVFDFEKPHEQPQRDVWLDAFYIDRHEVTNAEYEKLDPKHARDPRSGCDDCPVTKVSWEAARLYCVGQKPPKRLPTEAEWEKAAKGGTARRSEPLDEYAWYLPNAEGHTHPVGQKKPNGYGLYDTLGNVREWTADWYDPGYYAHGEAKNPKGPAEGERRVERGGAFFMFTRSVTPTIRYNHPPQFQLYFLGFRCAQDP